MVRTLQTTRINTSYVPQPRQIPVYPVVVEEVSAGLPPIRVENVVNLEDSSEEQLPTPTPLAESLAFAAGSSTSAPSAPAFQAPAPGGDDPDDSGDDDDEDDDDDEGGDEHINEEADYAEQDNFLGKPGSRPCRGRAPAPPRDCAANPACCPARRTEVGPTARREQSRYSPSRLARAPAPRPRRCSDQEQVRDAAAPKPSRPVSPARPFADCVKELSL
eukprot:XP_020400232.1 nucleophosmin-like [Zea mays]